MDALNVLENRRFVGKSNLDQQGRSLSPLFTVTFINLYVRNMVMRLKKDHIPNPLLGHLGISYLRT
jgi:hypothetical protein